MLLRAQIRAADGKKNKRLEMRSMIPKKPKHENDDIGDKFKKNLRNYRALQDFDLHDSEKFGKTLENNIIFQMLKHG